MNNEVVVKKENGGLPAQKTVQLVRLLNPHLAQVPDEEIIKAVGLAQYLGLDPVKKQVHFIPFGKTVQLVVGYLEYVKRAERSGKLNGWKVEILKEKDEVKAKVIIFRKDWAQPFEWEVFLREVAKDTPTWRQMPLFMLKKVAIAQAFRICFPEETAELPYEEAEIEGVIDYQTGEIIQTQPQTQSQPQPQVQFQQPQQTQQPQALPETSRWTWQEINRVATEELKEAVRQYGATSKILVELFNEFDGDQVAVINKLKEMAEERKKAKEGANA